MTAATTGHLPEEHLEAQKASARWLTAHETGGTGRTTVKEGAPRLRRWMT